MYSRRGQPPYNRIVVMVTAYQHSTEYSYCSLSLWNIIIMLYYMFIEYAKNGYGKISCQRQTAEMNGECEWHRYAFQNTMFVGSLIQATATPPYFWRKRKIYARISMWAMGRKDVRGGAYRVEQYKYRYYGICVLDFRIFRVCGVWREVLG